MAHGSIGLVGGWTVFCKVGGLMFGLVDVAHRSVGLVCLMVY